MEKKPKTKTRTRKKKFQILPFLKKHWVSASIIASAVIITGVFVGALSMIQSTSDYAGVEIKPRKFYSPLTGKPVKNEAATKQAVTGVMIENSPDARPQSGLKEAGVVYESVAEGGVTRFIALYQQEKPKLIGPVRSLRMYYLDWAAPYQASIAHVGGSPNALSEVRKKSYRDIDQFFNESSYWRSSDRYAPHNVYTNFSRLDKLNKNKGFKTSNFESFSRKDGKSVESPNAKTVNVKFSSPGYNTSYSYNQKSNKYNRSMAGSAHKDREKGQISPDVVVVIKVSTKSRANNSDGYEDIVTTGKGEAYVFQNGTVNKVTWKKDGRKSPLQLLDTEGKPFSLNRGQTWVAAITSRGGVSWK